jgi:hypothetical protein
MTTYYVEWQQEDRDVPTLSWHVTGTEEEALALLRFLEGNLEEWQDPIVREVADENPTIDDLMRELYNDWGLGNDDDD